MRGDRLISIFSSSVIHRGPSSVSDCVERQINACWESFRVLWIRLGWALDLPGAFTEEIKTNSSPFQLQPTDLRLFPFLLESMFVTVFARHSVPCQSKLSFPLDEDKISHSSGRWEQKVKMKAFTRQTSPYLWYKSRIFWVSFQIRWHNSVSMENIWGLSTN